MYGVKQHREAKLTRCSQQEDSNGSDGSSGPDFDDLTQDEQKDLMLQFTNILAFGVPKEFQRPKPDPRKKVL